MKKRIFAGVTMFIMAGLLIIACGKSGSYTSTTTPPTTPTNPPVTNGSAVTMSMTAFAPGSISVPAGTTVTWTNNDNMVHTVTSNTGDFDSGNVQPGGTFSHTFTATGTFNYKCLIHANMTGVVIVQ